MPILRCTLPLLLCLPVVVWGAQHYSIKVTDRKPQSRDHFVQGLEIVDGKLYVGTGLYGQSRLLRYDFESGQLLDSHNLNANFFGEGLTVLGDSIYQLTWRNRVMLVYRREDLRPLRSIRLGGEGWGLTNNGNALVYSDGSSTLRFMSADTGEVTRSLQVTHGGQPVRHLNELEWIDGAIWANVWMRDQIVIIDPASGVVTGIVDLRGLLPDTERRPGTDVLNGIARNPADETIWVTGKRWPWVYQVELVPTRSAEAADENPADSR